MTNKKIKYPNSSVLLKKKAFKVVEDVWSQKKTYGEFEKKVQLQ